MKMPSRVRELLGLEMFRQRRHIALSVPTGGRAWEQLTARLKEGSNMARRCVGVRERE